MDPTDPQSPTNPPTRPDLHDVAAASVQVGELAALAEQAASEAPAPPCGRSWLTHYAPGMPASLSVPDHSLAPLLDETARRYPTRPAIEFYGTTLTYAQLGVLADRFAHALLQLGISRGDRISLCLPNCPQFPIAFYGALKAGAVVVPTNPVYTAPEMAHQLRDAEVKVAVVIEQALPTLTAAREQTPVEHVLVTSIEEYLPRGLALAYRVREARDALSKQRVDMRALRSAQGVLELKDLLGTGRSRSGVEVFALPTPAAPNDLAVLQYTGGTTGLAKGAMLTHRN